MKPIKAIVNTLFTLALLGSTVFGQETMVTTLQLTPSPQALLKKLGAFQGWRSTNPAGDFKPSPEKLSMPHELLKECGFRALWNDTLTRGRNSINVDMLEFGDSSGAFSFYSLQTNSEMCTEAVGDQAASSRSDFWMWQSNLVVHLSANGQAGKLRVILGGIAKELSNQIRPRAELPSLVKQLPIHHQISGSVGYLLGPHGFQNLGIPVLVSKLGFEKGAEISTAKYQSPGGIVQLLLINYPTPQMARMFYATEQSAAGLLDKPSPSDKIFSKRAGPLVAIVLHAARAADAEKILNAIQYSANLTWDQTSPQEEVAAYLRKIVQSVMLTGLILMVTLGAGVVFGFIRLAFKRWSPIQIFDRPEDVELTQLQLWRKSTPQPKSGGTR